MIPEGNISLRKEFNKFFKDFSEDKEVPILHQSTIKISEISFVAGALALANKFNFEILLPEMENE